MPLANTRADNIFHLVIIFFRVKLFPNGDLRSFKPKREYFAHFNTLLTTRFAFSIGSVYRIILFLIGHCLM